MTGWGTQVVDAKLELVASGGWKQGLRCLGSLSLWVWEVDGSWGSWSWFHSATLGSSCTVHQTSPCKTEVRPSPTFSPRSLLGYLWLLL